eukprot:TRINITY_DN16909_c0_g1_i1.p1 TRINITY_DN16909_c0_g1~~TRINITY_DN16909_c0_g1_i1.p1  ORF type:complete len:282 (+),score=39.67 TRINITY_DN16909_c0_g1_i1:555-1400(+)
MAADGKKSQQAIENALKSLDDAKDSAIEAGTYETFMEKVRNWLKVEEARVAMEGLCVEGKKKMPYNLNEPFELEYWTQAGQVPFVNVTQGDGGGGPVSFRLKHREGTIRCESASAAAVYTNMTGTTGLTEGLRKTLKTGKKIYWLDKAELGPENSDTRCYHPSCTGKTRHGFAHVSTSPETQDVEKMLTAAMKKLAASGADLNNFQSPIFTCQLVWLCRDYNSMKDGAQITLSKGALVATAPVYITPTPKGDCKTPPSSAKNAAKSPQKTGRVPPPNFEAA